MKRWQRVCVWLAMLALGLSLATQAAGPAGDPFALQSDSGAGPDWCCAVEQAQQAAPAAPAAAATPAVDGRIPPGDPAVLPILYRFFDWGNDWQTLRPELGPVGSIHFYLWEDVNPAPGVYNWDVIDRQLERERALMVTLPDGRVVPKPVVIQIFPYISSNCDWEGVYFYDATPIWVYNAIDAANPSALRPVVNGRKVGYRLDGCGKVAVLPMYDNTTWQSAYYDCIRAFGARYNRDPQVTSVVINIGLDGETQLVKNFHCEWENLVDRDLPGVRYRFNQYMLRIMEVYRQAFPNKAVFVNHAPGGSGVRQRTAEYAATFDPPIGLKHSGMWVDLDIHQGYGDFVGSWDMVRQYSTTLPIWLESPYGFGSPELRYWSLLAGLHYHPDAIDLHPDYFTSVSPETLRWVTAHLGRSLADTPSVWTALRDAEYPLQMWGSSGASGYMGDWSFWLYRRDGPGGQTVRLWRNELPAEARGQVFARQARRTDQARGQPYMLFDVDDGYPYVNQPPLRDDPRGVAYVVKLILVNQGADTLSLQYRNAAGELASRTFTKGPALGPVNAWVTQTLVLDDAYLANGLEGGADFRISCNDDGDEIVHLVELVGQRPGAPLPTTTPAPTSAPTTPGPSPTPQPTYSPYPSATSARPTASPQPSATLDPFRTPSPTPAPTPTLLPGAALCAVAQDTTIQEWHPDVNYGLAPFLDVRQGDLTKTLLQFDLGDLAPGREVRQAWLSLYVYGRSNGGALPIRAFRVLRPWAADTATWQQADAHTAWAQTGCRAPDADLASNPVAAATLDAANAWVSLDVTAAVRQWLSDPASNRGLILVGEGEVAVQYTFSSSRWRDPSFRPRLMVALGGDAPTATPLPSPTPTPTPTVTLPPSPAPTASPTATAAVTPASLATPTPWPGALTIGQGQDAHLVAWLPNERLGAEPALWVRQGNRAAALLRFDLSAVPVGAEVQVAEVQLAVVGRSSASAMRLAAFSVWRPWRADAATWREAASGQPWVAAGCNGYGSDRDALPVAQTTLERAGEWLALDITALAQAWVNAPDANHGLLLQADAATAPGGYALASFDHPDPAARPRLLLRYTVD